MRAASSEDWRVTVSSKALRTRVYGVLGLALGVAIVGGLLSEWRDPAGMFFLVVGGLLAAAGVHFLRRAGKPMFEIDPTGLTYYPLDDISWKAERIPWERVRTVRYGVPTRGGRYVYFDYEQLPVRNWFTRAYDFVTGRRPDDPEPLAHAALPLMLSSIPEDELFQLLQQLSERHGFALELAG
jgi:hypothetical protein